MLRIAHGFFLDFKTCGSSLSRANWKEVCMFEINFGQKLPWIASGFYNRFWEKRSWSEHAMLGYLLYTSKIEVTCDAFWGWKYHFRSLVKLGFWYL